MGIESEKYVPSEEVNQEEKTREKSSWNIDLDIPESIELAQEQKDSIREIEWDLIGFETIPDMIEHEIFQRHNIVSALSYYNSYRTKLEDITSNLRDLPVEVGMKVIDRVSGAIEKADKLIPQFEGLAQENAMYLVKAFNDFKDKPESAVLFSRRIVQLKERCQQNGIDISAWENNQEVIKVLEEYPVEKQLKMMVEEWAGYYDDPGNTLNKKSAAGMAIKYYNEMSVRGITPDSELQERVEKLKEFYEQASW